MSMLLKNAFPMEIPEQAASDHTHFPGMGAFSAELQHLQQGR